MKGKVCKSNMKDFNEKIKKALLKKALGYTATEIIEEYANTDDGMVLQKKKITSKDIPPDLASFKALLENSSPKGEFDDLSDEQLLEEKNKLLKKLSKKENI